VGCRNAQHSVGALPGRISASAPTTSPATTNTSSCTTTSIAPAGHFASNFA
jgi:hypothetical protein